MSDARFIKIILDGPAASTTGAEPGRSYDLQHFKFTAQETEVLDEKHLEQGCNFRKTHAAVNLTDPSVSQEQVEVHFFSKKNEEKDTLKKNQLTAIESDEQFYKGADVVLYFLEHPIQIDDLYYDRLKEQNRKRLKDAPNSVPILVVYAPNQGPTYFQEQRDNTSDFIWDDTVLSPIRRILGCEIQVRVPGEHNAKLMEVLNKEIIKCLQLREINKLFDQALRYFPGPNVEAKANPTDHEVFADVLYIQEGRDSFKANLEPARKRILNDFKNGKLSYEQALTLASETEKLAKVVAEDHTPGIEPVFVAETDQVVVEKISLSKAISTFEENTKAAVSNSVHRGQIIGALIGAAVGVVLGVIIGGVVGMIIGGAAGGGVASAFTAPLFGAAGVALGAKIGAGTGAAVGATVGAYLGYKFSMWQHPTNKLLKAANKVNDGYDIAKEQKVDDKVKLTGSQLMELTK